MKMTLRRPPTFRAAVLAASTTFSLAALAASPDAGFVQKAAAGGMAEVEMGKLAQDKASADQVKQFGARMVQDHSKANDELKQVAGAKGVQLPPGPDAQAQSEMKKMQGMSGASFDKHYMDHMVSDHKKDIAAFESEAKSGKDPEVKAFAQKTLPTLKEHLQLAQQAQAAVK
jgi:putative membrane protein